MKQDVIFIQGGGEGAHEADGILAASLQNALGPEYRVRYPRMPDEADPRMRAWKAHIATQLAAGTGMVILVGHSLGSLALLKYLSEESIERPVAGLYLIATPSWDDANWHYDELKLVDDLAAKLAKVQRIVLYHSRDDEIVPFAHLALNASRLPRAIVRATDGRGHQFGNDLGDVAADIRSMGRAPTIPDTST